MTLQELISQASDSLEESYKTYMASKKALADLKKELKNDLKNNPEWKDLDQQLRLLTENRRDIKEQSDDIKKRQDDIAVEYEKYQVIQDFALESEEKYAEKKDKTLNDLAKSLIDKGMGAEIEYKNGRLILVVAKHSG